MVPEYVTERTIICRACPICDNVTEMCNAGLYLNPETNDVSVYPKEGYIKGCGCHLKWKIANIKSKCPAGKW
jgi:hypothetical protein